MAKTVPNNANTFIENLSTPELKTLLEQIQKLDTKDLLSILENGIEKEHKAQLNGGNVLIGAGCMVLALAGFLHVYQHPICEFLVDQVINCSEINCNWLQSGLADLFEDLCERCIL